VTSILEESHLLFNTRVMPKQPN